MNTEYNKFLKRYAVIAVILVGGLVALNVYVDIYGLFLGSKERKVYVNERTSKYLLSYRYIPENYDGFIVGPSLSANLNPKAIAGYKIYNASIMGANISDLHYLINNMKDRGNIKIAILCLDPYLTKDFGRKAATIDPKEYYGALGSTNLYKTYFMYVVRRFELLPGKYAKDLISSEGWNNFGLEKKDIDPKKAIEKKAAKKQYEETKIHPDAYKELQQVIQELREKNIKIVAYFSPVPYQLYSIGKKDYAKFEEQMRALFKPEDVLINLNDDKYVAITSDYNMYIDHGHLSASGQAFVLREINAALNNK